MTLINIFTGDAAGYAMSFHELPDLAVIKLKNMLRKTVVLLGIFPLTFMPFSTNEKYLISLNFFKAYYLAASKLLHKTPVV